MLSKLNKIFRMRGLFSVAFVAILAFIASVAVYSLYINSSPNLEEIKAQANSLKDNCSQDREWRRCYGDKIAVFAKNQTLETTLKVLSQTQEIDNKTKDCHLIAHKIASTEVEKNPNNWLSIFKTVNQDMCIGGYIHGAFEGKKRFDSNFELNETTIPQICDAINKTTGKKNYDPCAHVIGHIVLAEVNGDLDQATALCNSLPNTLEASCNNGSFMENITRDNLVEHGITEHIPFNELTAQMIEDTCRKFSGVSGTSCWREISHLYVAMIGNDPKKAWELCRRASSEANRDECYIHSFNSLMVSPNFNNDNLKFVCEPFLTSSKLNRCLDWAIHVMVYNSTKFTDRAISLCNSVGNNLEAKCFDILGKKLSKLVSLKEQENLCINSPDEYKKGCSCPNCARTSKEKVGVVED